MIDASGIQKHAPTAEALPLPSRTHPQNQKQTSAVYTEELTDLQFSWQVKEVPQPQPGPNQVLVKMHASGICYTDVHQTLGHLLGPFPRILGHEPVGEIVTVAPDVTTRKVGDRLGTAWIQSTCGRCEWCQRGRRMFCPYLKGTGIEAQGGHAEYMLMNADATYLIPDKVTYEQAAPIFCALASGCGLRASESARPPAKARCRILTASRGRGAVAAKIQGIRLIDDEESARS